MLQLNWKRDREWNVGRPDDYISRNDREKLATGGVNPQGVARVMMMRMRQIGMQQGRVGKVPWHVNSTHTRKKERTITRKLEETQVGKRKDEHSTGKSSTNFSGICAMKKTQGHRSHVRTRRN